MPTLNTSSPHGPAGRQRTNVTELRRVTVALPEHKRTVLRCHACLNSFLEFGKFAVLVMLHIQHLPATGSHHLLTDFLPPQVMDCRLYSLFQVKRQVLDHHGIEPHDAISEHIRQS